MRKFFSTWKNKIRNNRGSEVIQTLIVILIMGFIAIKAISAISSAIDSKNEDIIDFIGDINATTTP